MGAILAPTTPETVSSRTCKGSGTGPMESGGGYQPPHFEGMCTVCEEIVEIDDLHGVLVDHPAARPAIGSTVRVTFAGSEGFDPETVTGTVDRYDDDSITLDDGNLTTVYDTQLADGSATLEEIG